jgi:hypothetical protein
MKPVFGDVFRYFLAGLNKSSPTSILNLIMNYIDICFDTINEEESLSLLAFVGIFLRCLENVPSNGFYFQKCLSRLLQNMPMLTKLIEEDTTPSLLTLIEEFIMLGTPFQTFNLPDYLISLYSILADESKGICIETSFIIKTSILSLFMTMILISLEANNFQLANYEVI